MAGLVMSPQVFSILSGLVEERAGLHYGLEEREIFTDKVGTRAEEAGFESLLDYYYFLRYDPAGPDELQALVETLVVGETFFFRELGPLEVIVSEMIAPAVAAGRRPRVWCAASATGEEPLTLAMLLDERGLLGKVELVASDISQRSLRKAQEGRASRRSIRQAPKPHLVEKWLHVGADAVTVDPALIRTIQWKQVNLLDPAAIAALGKFDVILCRNVLIYFREATTQQVVGSLARQLGPDGVLCVGVSESLMRFGSALECHEQGGAFFYRPAESGQ